MDADAGLVVLRALIPPFRKCRPPVISLKVSAVGKFSPSIQRNPGDIGRQILLPIALSRDTCDQAVNY
jgi:hypothetical protein